MGKTAASMGVLSAATVALLAVQALAVNLGDVEVRSYLGQPLAARIALRPTVGESINEDCVSLAPREPGRTGDIDLLTDARISVRTPSGGRDGYITVTSAQAINEPVVRFMLKLSCGAQGSFYREFTLLLDPPGFATAAPARAVNLPTVESTAAPRPLSEYIVKEGDTLASIAASVYPDSRRAQRALRRAIVKANSDVLPSPSSPLPQAGTPLLIPELSPDELRPAASAQTRKSRPRTVAKKKPEAQRTPQPQREEFVATRKDRAAPISRTRDSGFVLKLSRGSLDVATGQALSESERQALRERQKLLDADDQTASILALQHALRQMQAEIAELRAQLGKPAPATVAAAPTPSATTTPALVIPEAPTAPVVEESPPAPPAPAQEATPSESQPVAAEGPAPAAREVIAQAPAPEPVAAAAPEPAERRVVYDSPSFLNWVFDHKGMLLLLALALGGLMIYQRRQRQGSATATEFAFEGKTPRSAAGAQKRVPATKERARESATTTTPRQPARVREQPAEKNVPEVRVEPKAAPAKLDQAARDINDRYLAERFPEIIENKLDLRDADAVISQAQTYFLEDGDADKTVEFLEHVVANNPGEPKIWFALLELLRQVRLKGAYEKAAQQFKQLFSDPGQWARVCTMGSTLDPDNPLYRLSETALVEQPEHKPVFAQENWLDLPLDFTPEDTKQDALRSELLAALPPEHEPALTLSALPTPDPTPEPTLARPHEPKPAASEQELGSMIERAMRDKGLPS